MSDWSPYATSQPEIDPSTDKMKPPPAVTQMINLQVPVAKTITLSASTDGIAWQAVLDFLEKQPGFVRLYWGRRVEIPDTVQLHIVRDKLQQHRHFLTSPSYKEFEELIAPLSDGTPLTIRHALIHENSAGCQSLGKGSPVTGTAIYLNTTTNWDARWDEWISIVQHVPGFMGISGGHVIEDVDGQPNAFIALVGWENVELHDRYHHTKHFLQRRHVLAENGGFNYYGHIKFENEKGRDSFELVGGHTPVPSSSKQLSKI